MALSMVLKFHTRVGKWLKLKVRKFEGLIFAFVDVTGKNMVMRGGRVVCPSPPPILNQVKDTIKAYCYECHLCLTQYNVI